jgi:ribonuclease P protein component
MICCTILMAHFTLSKDQRLKSRKLIGKVFSDGKPVQSFPVRAVCLFSETNANSAQKPDQSAATHNLNSRELYPYSISEILQAGFSVSTRNFKKAVDRNRVKRLMKEVYRKKRPELEAGLISAGKQLSVFFIFTGKELPAYELVEEKMHLVIKRILEQINGNAQKNI